MIFRIHAGKNDEDKQWFLYDNETNTLSNENGLVYEMPKSAPVIDTTALAGDNQGYVEVKRNNPTNDSTVSEGAISADIKDYQMLESIPFSKDVPLKKSKTPTILKIQLGLSCNYSCEYCSQRFVDRPEETNKKDVDGFMTKLENFEFSEDDGLKIEFWGGEPMVYWKTIVPLVEALNEKFTPWTTKPHYSMITNGSLFTAEKCQWLYDQGFSIGMSHDGPGQSVRGPDPFEDPQQKKIILDFYNKMKLERRFSFNAMLNAQNISRKAIHNWFIDVTGDPDVSLGEGGLVDSYDEGGLELALNTKKEHFEFRKQAFADINDNDGFIGFGGMVLKVNYFVMNVLGHSNAKFVGQKCGMDKEDTIAVDLRGNVITCQNVSAVEVAGNGESHLAGNITDLAAVEIKTATHWRNRPHCSACPVVQLCQGSCMYLQGENWHTSCANAYSDNIALFALAFRQITGYMPIYIDADFLPPERRDIWGVALWHTEDPPKKKSFPIKVVTEKKIVNDQVVYTKSSLVREETI
jgi:uncharacterized protein